MKESPEFIIGYASVCTVIWAIFFSLARYVDSKGPLFCRAWHPDFDVKFALVCRIIAYTAVWYGIGVIFTVALRYIYNTWLDGSFKYVYLLPIMIAAWKWILGALFLFVRYFCIAA